MIEIGTPTPFREYLKSRNVIMTPPELFALPVGTILQAGRFGGVDCYECIYQIGEVTLFFDSKRKTAVKDELAILFRGVPNTIKYHPKLGMHKAAFDQNVIVTVLGFSNRPEAPKSRKNGSNWAFIDSVEKK